MYNKDIFQNTFLIIKIRNTLSLENNQSLTSNLLSQKSKRKLECHKA
jgi:hypothetical protein